MRLGELAKQTAARLVGDAEFQVQDARCLLTASRDHITFVNDEKHLFTVIIFCDSES